MGKRAGKGRVQRDGTGGGWVRVRMRLREMCLLVQQVSYWEGYARQRRIYMNEQASVTVFPGALFR